MTSTTYFLLTWDILTIFKNGLKYQLTPKNHILGILVGTVLSPSLYLSYDCNVEKFAVVGAISHAFDLSQYAITGIGIDIGAHIVYYHCNKPGIFDYRPAFRSKDYIYYGLNADFNIFYYKICKNTCLYCIC